MSDPVFPKQIHPSITAERVQAACQAYDETIDNTGFCVKCGADAEGCEPDARGYRCEACGEMAVYGAQEVALMTFI
jgi:hypothetical protein